MCHIFVQDGGEHAEVLVIAANSHNWKVGSCALGNGTSRDSRAAAAMTLPLFKYY
jgi:ribosomal protein S12 methylthiotransferase accessory factor YcaO